MKNPIPSKILTLPPLHGHFGAIRKHDIHTGVDLYADVGTKVCAMESGYVVSVQPFTGAFADSPWWLDTMCVMVEGDSGVILYGEVKPCVAEGDYVFAGTCLGTVMQVLKNNKGNPISMLHLELYTPGTRDPVWWKLTEPMPSCLCDPMPLLEKITS